MRCSGLLWTQRGRPVLRFEPSASKTRFVLADSRPEGAFLLLGIPQGAAEAGSSAWTEQQIRPAHEANGMRLLAPSWESPRPVLERWLMACKKPPRHGGSWMQAPVLAVESATAQGSVGRCSAGLANPDRPQAQKEYDRRLEMGRPPRVEARATRKRPEVEAPRKAKPPEPKPAPSPASPQGRRQIEEAKVLISQGKFKAAVSLLESARSQSVRSSGARRAGLGHMEGEKMGVGGRRGGCEYFDWR